MKLSTLFIIASLFFATAASAAATSGLSYSYFEGNFPNMPDFSSMTALKTGASANTDLSVRSRDTYYAILWQGSITIPATGTYTFETVSDDGSMLYIGSSAVVNNDGQHGTQTRTGSITLAAGVYPVKIAFMNACCEGVMQLYWSSNAGLGRQLVPDNAFIPAAATTTTQGLEYSYFEGTWTNLPDLASMKAIKTGASSNLDLSVRSRDTYYALLWQGFITIPSNGTYTFETVSDDGSMLYIGQSSALLVNNDGQHGTQTRTGSLYLAAGVYPIKIAFMNACCEGVMQLYWSSNAGLSRQLVPDNAFSHTAAATTATTASGLDYSYFEGTWTNLPDLASMKALKTGASSNLDLSVRSRDTYYAILWQGFITIPASATYTFETVSDDGSMLYIGSSDVVNNDGQHGTQTRTGSLYLAAGVYPIKIAFMNACCEGVMQLYWSSSAGLSRQLVADAAFSHTAASATPVDPIVSTSTETGGLTAAVNYYFSSSTGDDARSAAQAQNQATPWKTLNKLNAIIASAAPGTAMLLKRGDTFEGSVNITVSGSPSAPIIISAYGTGNKPVISGFAPAASTNWTSLGNGIWEAPLTTSISKMNMVARDNNIQGMGRWPNITAANRGYMTFEAHNGNQTIVDNELTGYPNWTGAELVIRKNRWTIDRGTVIYHSGNTIAQTDPSGMEPINGFGYFIQNDPRTLDQLGEWYYNPSAKKVQIFTGGASPASYGFKPSVTDTLLIIRSKSYITLDNISLQGANAYAIAVWDNANFVSIQNCSIDFSGVNAIAANFTRSLSLTGSVINHTNNNGLYLAPYCVNTTIKNNTIKNTGLIPGMGSSNNQAHEGMTIDGAGSIIQNNIVDSTGYIAIAFTRDSVTVINNFVSNFALTTDDGAGIYTHDPGFKGRRILNNIVINGKGSHEGTDNTQDLAAQGIGTDDMTTDVEISGNTVANCSGKGIGLHNSQSITVSDNTAFNNKGGQIGFEHDFIAPNSPTRSISMHGNILFAKTAVQPVFNIVSKDDDIALFGSADNNYYCRPIDDKLTFNMQALRYTGQDKDQNYDLAHWRGCTAQDINSKKSPLSIAPYTVVNTGTNMIANGSFDANMAGAINASPSTSSMSLDKGTMDGGALRVTYSGNGAQSLNVVFYDPSNPQTLLAGHSYRVSFSIKGNQDNNSDFYAVIYSATGSTLTDTKSFKVYSTRQEIELIYVPTANIPAAYLSVFMMNAAGCPGFVMDNVKMQEVTLNYTNVDDYIRFEYNATSAPKTVALDAEYVDAKNVLYSYSITLAPYSSAVLVKKSASVLVQAQDQTLAVTASAKAGTEGYNEPVLPISMKVSPNPATSQIQLNHGLQISTAQPATITLYNAGGTAVKTIKVNLTSQPVTINIADLTAGVYSIKLDTNNKTTVTRFIKM